MMGSREVLTSFDLCRRSRVSNTMIIGEMAEFVCMKPSVCGISLLGWESELEARKHEILVY